MPAPRPPRSHRRTSGVGGQGLLAALLAGVLGGWLAGLLRAPKGPVR